MGRPVQVSCDTGRFLNEEQTLPKSLKCPLYALQAQSHLLSPAGTAVLSTALTRLLSELLLQDRLAPLRCDCPLLCVCSEKTPGSWVYCGIPQYVPIVSTYF